MRSDGAVAHEGRRRRDEERAGHPGVPGPSCEGAPRREPIRVASFLDSMAAGGGTELNAVRTAERLDPAHVRLSVVALRADGPMRGRYEAAGIPVLAAPPLRSLVGPDLPGAVLGLARLLRAHRIEVVHAHDVYTNFVATLAARVARGFGGAPRIITSKRWWVTQRKHRPLNLLAYRLADRVLANSTSVGESLTRADGVPAGRVVVVPNFVDDAAFATPDDAWIRTMRARWGIPSDAPVVGVVARLRPEKDHGSFLTAVARLRTEVPELRAVVVGDGPCEASLLEQGRTLGLGDALVLAGHLPQVPNPHALFDVSVLPSLHEGFPNTVVEAMAAARPVVATAVGGVPDAVVDGETGLLVPPRAPERLAAALGPLLADPERRQRMGGRGRAIARERFHASAVLPRLERLYASLVPHAAPH